MRRGRRKRNSESSNLAFLDIMSCGFGAVVLLLLIIKTTAPEPVEENLKSHSELQAQLEELQTEADDAQSELDDREQELDSQKKNLAQILEQLGKSKKSLHDSGIATMASEKLKGQLQAALQSLDEEMRMLKVRDDGTKVGGIPADSRHIIFVVDTSGSMKSYAWDKAMEQLAAILDAYPQIEGIQVINDQGKHLFEGYRGRWIRDTPGARSRILRAFKDWGDYSNSNPVEGIYTAITEYASKAKKLSLYVMGDDFSGSVQEVLETVDKLNKSAGSKKIRVHAIGFFTPGVEKGGFLSFARLTALTRRNRGTFIGLSTR